MCLFSQEYFQLRSSITNKLNKTFQKHSRCIVKHLQGITYNNVGYKSNILCKEKLKYEKATSKWSKIMSEIT